MDTGKKSFNRLILGIWIIMVPVTIIGMIIDKDSLRFLYGELLGSLVATGMACHIYHTLDVALDRDPEGAARHVRGASLLRSLLSIGVLVLGFYFHVYISPIGIFLGLMGLKISVYLQPLIEIVYNKTKKGKE